jgi:uncharacterized membrane protein
VTHAPRTTSSSSQSNEEGAKRVSAWAVRITAILNRLVHAFAKHWLFATNTVAAASLALPVLAPTLMAAGCDSAGRAIYTLFAPLCHQLPERSFFLFGPQLTYSLQELEQLIGPHVPLRYIGNRALGYKMAICQRDIALYLAILVFGLAFTLLRERLSPLPIKMFALLSVPIALDGFGQLLALWESTWWSRALSGALFGVACVWLAYPYIESGMRDVLRVMQQEQHKTQS